MLLVWLFLYLKFGKAVLYYRVGKGSQRLLVDMTGRYYMAVWRGYLPKDTGFICAVGTVLFLLRGGRGVFSTSITLASVALGVPPAGVMFRLLGLKEALQGLGELFL